LKKYYLNLKYGNIYLKPVDIDCIDNGWLNWVNDPELNKYLNHKKKLTRVDLINYLNQNHLFFACYIKETKEYFGNIRIYYLSEKLNIVSLGRLIGNKKYLNQGYGKQLMKIGIDISFNLLKCSKLIVGNHKDNISSKKSKENFNFLKLNNEQITLYNLDKDKSYEYYFIEKNN
jgi:RimJ/RimL family protein N-acetyltransferase